MMIRSMLATVGGVLLCVTGVGATPEKGQQVFVAQKCSMCHSVAGKGNPKGALDGVGSKYKPDELRQWIVNPAEMAAKHKTTRTPAMKDFSKLPPTDVDALVEYLATLKK
jgi:mono/diheme cytochrome c family protein